MEWFRLYDGLVYDPAVQLLSPSKFKSQFLAAAKGEKNPFSRYIKPAKDRPSPWIWAQIRKRIFKRDDFTCQYCGARGRRLECDHVIPVSKGGSHGDVNLVTSCFQCNRSKRSMLLKDWKPR